MNKFIEFWKHDWAMKLVALGIAALLWLFVIAQQNPVRVKDFENIPVSYKGVEQLEINGLCLADGLSDVVSSVNVSVEATTDVLQYLSSDNITATLDFSDITVAGEYVLKVKAKSDGGNIYSVSPDEVSVTIENLVSRELPVEVQVIGNDNRNMYYGEPEINTETVTVSGTQTDVESFTKAIVVMDVSHASSSVTESKMVSLLTDSGNIISANEYDRLLPSVIVKVPVYHTVSVPVDADEILASVYGIADGYEITGIELSDEKVKIAAPEDVLKNIKSIKYSKTNLEKATHDITVQIYPELPNGTVAAEPEYITAKILIGEIKDSKKFSAVAIRTKNLNPKFKCEIDPETIDVNAVGKKEILDTVGEKDVIPYVDLSDLGVGTHEVMIKFEPVTGTDVDFEPGIINAVVRIARK